MSNLTPDYDAWRTTPPYDTKIAEAYAAALDDAYAIAKGEIHKQALASQEAASNLIYEHDDTYDYAGALLHKIQSNAALSPEQFKEAVLATVESFAHKWALLVAEKKAMGGAA